MVERRLSTDEEARALASSVRVRILRVCREPHTNKEIAETLGVDPATMLHHVRRLVDTGFLVAQPVRRGTRGAREIPYLATGKSWQLSSPGAGPVMLDVFLEEVALVPAADVDTSRLGLRLPPEQFEEFRDRMQTLLDEFADRPEDPTAPAWSVFLAMHPDPNRK
ncbi:MAG TPA: winged helix-turn-helix domain-containing protein [Jatrophihabitantaceae bacterium]